MANPVVEIIAQVLWLILAVWLIHRGYALHKKSKPFSLKEYKASENVDASFIAGGVVSGIVLIILLAYKLFSCGFICWS
jgi:uncharacterized protein involved in cysteine biosynthesis